MVRKIKIVLVLAAFFVLGIGLLSIAVTKAVAQTVPIADHIKCYKVSFVKGALVVSTHAGDPLDLTPYQVPPFAVEKGCVIAPKPVMFCIPVDKQPRQLPLGTNLGNDFFVYKAKCLAEPDFKLSAGDQFVRGEMIVRRKTTTRLLLVPAYKAETPPDPCDSIAPHMCGGQCPAGQVCRPGPVDICGCFDDTTTQCDFIPGTNTCNNGPCAIAGQICQLDPAVGCRCK